MLNVLNWLKPSKSLWFSPACHPRWQADWTLIQWAILVLPLSTLLGGVTILLWAIAVWLRHGRSLLRQPLNWGWIGLSGLILLSCALGYVPGNAFLGAFNFIPFFFVAAALSQVIQTIAQVRRLAWLLVIGSVPVLLVGLGQQFWGWSGQIDLLWVVAQWHVQAGGNPPGRMASLFFYANVLASYLVMTFTLSFGLWLEACDRCPITWRHLRQVRWHDSRLLLTIVLLAHGLALVFTNSRNAWAIAAGVILVVGLYRGWHGLTGLVVVGVGTVFAAAYAPPPLRGGLRTIVPAFFWARITDDLYPDRPEPLMRATQWKFAWNMAWERPWLGWGLRSFTPLYQAQSQVFLGHPHNLPLMLMAEMGIPATLLFVGLVGGILAQACRRFYQLWDQISPSDRLMLLTVLLSFLSLTVFSLFDVTLFDARVNLIGWLLLASLWGVSQGMAPQRP